jgi:hypothetical protein
MTALRQGVTMHLYQSIAVRVGTRAAFALAPRLAVWHDDMVRHQRRARASRESACAPDCPHNEARSLWLEALEAYGDEARQLGFLRTHGGLTLHFSGEQNR